MKFYNFMEKNCIKLYVIVLILSGIVGIIYFNHILGIFIGGFIGGILYALLTANICFIKSIIDDIELSKFYKSNK